MKAVSLLPAVTQMIYDMKLERHLVGVTFECPPRARLEKPVVVKCKIEPNSFTSEEIDQIFSKAKHSEESMYVVEQQLLEDLRADIIFTQDVCDICQIDTNSTMMAVAKLSKQPQIIPITPISLNDVFDNAITIAKALGYEEVGREYVRLLKDRSDRVLSKLREHNMPLKSVSVLEWLKPLYNCGHWIPFQVAQAGGVDALSNPAGDSFRLDWNRLLRYNPEVIVVAPCGFPTERTMQEINLLTELPHWNELRAVQNKQVFVVDYTFFTQSSASTLVAGIELLAGLFHPEVFSESISNEKLAISNL